MDYNTPSNNLPHTGPPDAWAWLAVIAVLVVAGVALRWAATR